MTFFRSSSYSVQFDVLKRPIFLRTDRKFCAIDFDMFKTYERDKISKAAESNLSYSISIVSVTGGKTKKLGPLS